MTNAAQPSPRMTDDEWDEAVPGLREELLRMQQRLREANVPTVFITAGADGVKSQTVNRLTSWLDPRGLDVHAFSETDEARLDRPDMWLYFTSLPARGRIGMYFGSWYAPIVTGWTTGGMSIDAVRDRLDRLARFERTLVDDGYLVIKAWFELTEDEQRARLERFSADPAEQWRVLPRDWQHLENFERFVELRDEVLGRTETPGAEWASLPAADDHWREAATARLFLSRAEDHLVALNDERNGGTQGAAPADDGDIPAESPLSAVDLSLRMKRDEYEQAMAVERTRLRDLSLALPKAGRSAVLVFEGWDASGKGGTIRRLVEPMDARTYRVVPYGSPTEEELRHHYLWRFWREVPRSGKITIYDRSWYGRVLVERVEGLASRDEWRRAYREIREFEADLTGRSIVLCKFWLQLSPDEQLARFEARAEIPHKRHKLTDEDWRNREKRPEYEAAVAEMYHRTHRPPNAPWYLVAAEQKRVARVQVLRTVADRLEEALG